MGMYNASLLLGVVLGGKDRNSFLNRVYYERVLATEAAHARCDYERLLAETAPPDDEEKQDANWKDGLLKEAVGLEECFEADDKTRLRRYVRQILNIASQVDGGPDGGELFYGGAEKSPKKQERRRRSSSNT